MYHHATTNRSGVSTKDVTKTEKNNIFESLRCVCCVNGLN